MPDNRFRKLWDEYAKLLPSDVGEVQIQETRRAFYAGGAALFGAVINMLDPGTEPTDDDLRKMTALQTEFETYMLDVAEGRA